mgnify:CR=1 FL=1
MEITTISTLNDIFQIGGVFLAQVQKKKLSILNPPPKKRGRKEGGKNRPKAVIQKEKQEKAKNPGKRGRPKKKKDIPIYIFKVDKGNGCIQPWCEGAQDAANILTSVFHVFEEKCITTNPIEKEFSAFKILICFRGRRSISRWKRLVQGYCWIRNNPFIIKQLLAPITLSGTAIKNALIHQLGYGVQC